MNGYLDDIALCLPSEVMREVRRLCGEIRIREIRLRSGAPASVTTDSGNLTLSARCGEEQLSQTVSCLCGHSMHSHADTIINGYIDRGGVRVGVCGRACGGEISSVRDISSVNIRFPPDTDELASIRSGDEFTSLLKKLDGRHLTRGALVFSPPGAGKTTLLRLLAVCASETDGSALRTAIVDTRGELYDRTAMSGCLIDVLHGYPKGRGIEIATRTLSPQLIVCDEIGGEGEAGSILTAQNTGVPLLASAHAQNSASLYRRPQIRKLIENGVFDLFIGISIENGGRKYSLYESVKQ